MPSSLPRTFCNGGPIRGGRISRWDSTPRKLEVLAVVAERFTTEGTYPILERLVDTAAGALAVVRLRPAQVMRPGPFEIGNVVYLAARIQLRQPVEVLTHA